MSETSAEKRDAYRFILLLGLVSLFADATYESARSILGQFLGSLGATASSVGVIAGLGELLNNSLRIVSGHVADLNAALNDAAVFVAPLRFAAGIQNKVLEAMAAGLPVVASSFANEGLEAEDGRHLIVADEAETLAAAIAGLLHDAARRRELGRQGRAFVLQRYRWEAVLDRMERIEGQLTC